MSDTSLNTPPGETKPLAEPPQPGAGTSRLLWSSARAWSGKGAFALLDQGLISGSNFLIAVLLARRLSPQRYGAFALAFEAFLFLAVVYGALVLEPLSVFGSSVYSGQLRVYLGRLVRLHAAVAATLLTSILAGAWVYHLVRPASELPAALAGVAVAGPCVLLFWLTRRIFYVKLDPRQAAKGAAVYCATLVSGLIAVRHFGLLSPFSAFLVMAAGAAVTAPIMLALPKPAFKSSDEEPTTLQVIRRHWDYGRWSLSSAVTIWLSAAIFYPLLASSRGLAYAGELKALMNFSSPVGQAFAAFSLLSLPYAARIHHEAPNTAKFWLVWKLTALYGGGTLLYWIFVIAFREPIVAHLYAGKYLALTGLLPWVALGSVLRISATAQAITLRAMHAPSRVFAAYGTASVVALAAGIPLTRFMGLRGAIMTLVLSSAVALIVASAMVRRRSDVPMGSQSTSLEENRTMSVRRLRIAWLAPSLERGWRWQLLLAEFTRLCPGTVIFTGRWPGFTPGFEDAFKIHRVPGFRTIKFDDLKRNGSQGFIWVSPVLLWDLLTFRPDIILTNGFHLGTSYAVVVKTILRSRLILLWQGISSETGGEPGTARLCFRRFLARSFDLSVCNSKPGVEYLKSQVGMPAEKVMHFFGEVASRESFGDRTVRREPLSRVRRPVFLFAGSLKHGKGVNALFRACAYLVGAGVNRFTVQIVGAGPQEAELRRLAEALAIADHVIWEGYVPYHNLPSYYERCDVCVLPSLEDTWGVVAVEAMAFGKPILCSRLAGASEIINPGVNGNLFDPRRPEELASHMKQLIHDPDLIVQWGKASSEFMARHTPRNTARELFEIVCGTLHRKAPVQQARPLEHMYL